jgi:hypothetical protein
MTAHIRLYLKYKLYTKNIIDPIPYKDISNMNLDELKSYSSTIYRLYIYSKKSFELREKYRDKYIDAEFRDEGHENIIIFLKKYNDDVDKELNMISQRFQKYNITINEYPQPVIKETVNIKHKPKKVKKKKPREICLKDNFNIDEELEKYKSDHVLNFLVLISFKLSSYGLNCDVSTIYSLGQNICMKLTKESLYNVRKSVLENINVLLFTKEYIDAELSDLETIVDGLKCNPEAIKDFEAGLLVPVFIDVSGADCISAGPIKIVLEPYMLIGDLVNSLVSMFGKNPENIEILREKNYYPALVKNRGNYSRAYNPKKHVVDVLKPYSEVFLTMMEKRM